MNIDRTKLEKLFEEHFIDEPSSDVFNVMNDIIDYAEKAVKLFDIPDVVWQSEQLFCGRDIKTCLFYQKGVCTNEQHCRDQVEK